MSQHRLSVFFLFGALMLGGCALDRYSQTRHVSWSLSPMGKGLAYMRCDIQNSPCTIALYSFEHDKTALYRNGTGAHWGLPSFSPDAKMLAFAVNEPGTDNRQIAIMSRDGTGYRVVTSEPGLRSTPTFSLDGKMLTYVCSAYLSKRYFTPYKGNVRRARGTEICVLDIASGEEKKITSLDAYILGPPAFLPDGEHVLYFYEDGITDPETNKRKLTQATLVTNINTRKSTKVLTEMPNAHYARLTGLGRRAVFSVMTNEMDANDPDLHEVNGVRVYGYNYDLFLWEGGNDILNGDGTIRRLTKARSYVSGFTLSADGRILAYALDASRKGEMKFFLMNLDSGKNQPFVLPKRIDAWIETDTKPAS